MQIAQAESDVADARLELQNAREDLADLGEVAADQLAQARLDILNAQSDLETAIENKATLSVPTNGDVVRAEADVTAARVALQDAKDVLDTLLNPDSEEIDDRIAEFQAGIESAEESVVTERLDLEAAERNAEDRIQPVAEDLDTAQADYNDLFVKWARHGAPLPTGWRVPRGYLCGAWHRLGGHLRGVSHSGDAAAVLQGRAERRPRNPLERTDRDVLGGTLPGRDPHRL